MLFNLFPALCLLGAVLAAPSVDKCDLERENMFKCSQGQSINLHDWENFEKNIPLFNDWLECIGELSCEYNRKAVQKAKAKFDIVAVWSRTMGACLADDTISEFNHVCSRSRTPDCDESFHQCVTNHLKSHEPCTTENVNTYISTIPDMMKYCVLKEELKALSPDQ